MLLVGESNGFRRQAERVWHDVFYGERSQRMAMTDIIVVLTFG